MGKFSRAVALAGLALIVLSFLPWPAGGSPQASTMATVPTRDPVDQGAALFRAKGCVSCHRHDAVDAEGGQIGPDLTQYVVDPVFLRDWLQDPAAIRPDTQMPDLQLQPAEIEALIAFLQRGSGEPESGSLNTVSGRRRVAGK